MSNSKLMNFDIFMCDKCGEIIIVIDVISLNKATSHAMYCICNAQLVKEYKNELKKCTFDFELRAVHEKYLKLIN